MPTTVLRTVQPRLVSRDGRRAPPGRRSNAVSGREREYLTPAEIERLVKTARKRGRYGSRDALAILMGFRHGLRVSELVGLRWSQVDFTTARLTVHRAKRSAGSTQPILGDGLRELRKLQRVGAESGLTLIHASMLRHSTGFTLADKGRDLREIQDYLGHRSINNTVIYTKLRPGRFDQIWD